jgi:anti-sigma factor RsiW
MASNPACQTFVQMLSPFVDGELSSGERQTVERHLSVCKDCTGRVADFRAESGLVRLGMEMLADDVDFKDFANKVMARVTPQKLPLLERWKLSLNEMFEHQRGAFVASMVGAAAALVIALPLILRGQAPLGYASQQMAVQAVETEGQAHVSPVVMTPGGGDAIIWLVDQPVEAAPNEAASEELDEELDMEGGAQENKKPLNPERPEGGPL